MQSYRLMNNVHPLRVGETWENRKSVAARDIKKQNLKDHIFAQIQSFSSCTT